MSLDDMSCCMYSCTYVDRIICYHLFRVLFISLDTIIEGSVFIFAVRVRVSRAVLKRIEHNSMYVDCPVQMSSIDIESYGQ